MGGKDAKVREETPYRSHVPEDAQEADQPGLDTLRDAVRNSLPSNGPGVPARRDAIGSLSTALANIPDGMASALLAGVSPIHGLYASAVGPTVGGILSSSALVVVTTTSAASLAVGETLSGMPAQSRVGAMSAMVLLIGVFQLLLGLLGAGRLVRFVSYSVMTGFIMGIAVLTILSQVPTVTGSPANGATPLIRAVDVITHLAGVRPVSLVLAATTLGITVALVRTRFRAIAALLGILAPSVATAALSLSQVETVKDLGGITRSLPLPSLPSLGAINLDVMTAAFAAAAIILIQGAGVSQSVPNTGKGRKRLSGSLELDVSDLSITSWGPAAEVARSYTSSSSVEGSFAPGWRFNFEQSLTCDSPHNPSQGSTATYTDATGEAHVFTYSDSVGGWIAPNGYFAALEHHAPLLGSHYWNLTFSDHSVLAFDESSAKLLSETDNSGNQTTYSHGDPLLITAANGQQISVDYESGKVASASYGTVEGTRRIEYSAAGATATVTRFADTDYAYDTEYGYSSSRLSTLSVPSVDSTWSVSYVADDAITVANTSGGGTPTMTRETIWDLASRSATVTTFDGATRYEWNPTGTTKVRSNEGSATLLTQLSYDGQNLPVREETPQGHETSRVHDSRGNSIFEWDTAGRLTRSVYDGRGNLVRTIDPKGSVTYSTYDEHDNMVVEEKTLTSSGEKARSEYTYDYSGAYKGRLTFERSKVSGSPEVWAEKDYDDFDSVSGESGRVIELDVKLATGGDGENVEQRSTYDAWGQLLTETDPLGVRTVLSSYDLAGRVYRSEDASGVVTNTRSSFGQLLADDRADQCDKRVRRRRKTDHANSAYHRTQRGVGVGERDRDAIIGLVVYRGTHALIYAHVTQGVPCASQRLSLHLRLEARSVQE